MTAVAIGTSLRVLVNVVTLFMIAFVIFALAGVSLYRGSLKRQCVLPQGQSPASHAESQVCQVAKLVQSLQDQYSVLYTCKPWQESVITNASTVSMSQVRPSALAGQTRLQSWTCRTETTHERHDAPPISSPTAPV